MSGFTYKEQYAVVVINKLLAAGWTIRKRDFINVPGEISEAFNITTKQLLYAELERFEPPLFEEVTM